MKGKSEQARLVDESSAPAGAVTSTNEPVHVCPASRELPRTWVELIGFQAQVALDSIIQNRGEKPSQILVLYLPFFAVLLLLSLSLGAVGYFLWQWSGALGVGAGTVVLAVVGAVVRMWFLRRR